MKKKPTIEQFNKIMQAIAEDLLKSAQEQLGTEVWKSVFFDTRSPKKGYMGFQKFRAVLPDGSLKELDSSIKVAMLLIDAWNIKNKVFPDKWYGIKFTIYPDGKCETVFNYDPNCMTDPVFFKS